MRIFKHRFAFPGLLLLLFLLVLPARAQDVTITEKQTIDDQTFAYDLALGNELLFAGGDDLIRYQIDDTGQAVNPLILPYNGEPIALAATDQLLAVGDFAATVTLFDISDPDNPVERGSANTAGATLDIAARGTLVATTPDFLAQNVVEIFDVSDPDNPVRAGQYRPGAFAAGVFLAESGTELLVTTEDELEVVDVSDPSNPVLLGSIALAGRGNKVAVQGARAFVGSQGEEDGQGETNEWFLEAFDISDPASPQVLGATGGDDGPLHAMTGLVEGFLMTSSPAGLQVFSFEETTGAFKVMDGSFTSAASFTGPSPTSVVGGSFSNVPSGCIPVFTNASTTLFSGSFETAGVSADGDVTGYEVKVPPSGGATLTTAWGATPRVECPSERGTPVIVGEGSLTAEGEGIWRVNALTFRPETSSEPASLRKEFVQRIELLIGGKTVAGDLSAEERTFQNPATQVSHTLNYITRVIFSGLAEEVAAGETLPFSVQLIMDKPEGDDPICSVLEPVKQMIAQFNIHGVVDVDADPPAGGVKLPDELIRGGKINMACVIDVTPDPNLGFGFIQAGIDGSADFDRIGVCPGLYKENIRFADDQKGRTLFSFKGPQQTEIRSVVGNEADVVTIEGDQTRLQGFAVREGARGVFIKADNVIVGNATPGKAIPRATFPLILCQSCNRIAGNEINFQAGFFGGMGIEVEGKGAIIAGNFIGTTASGKEFDTNRSAGVFVRKQAENTHILNNLISGNKNVGLAIEGKNTLIAGNSIGLDNEALRTLAFQDVGLNILGENTTVGVPGNGNVISGHAEVGMNVGATKTGIFGNTIGLNRLGEAGDATENGSTGIFITNSSDTRIGGSTADSSNVISGNGGSGIFINLSEGETLKRLHILGNLIGVNRSGEPTGNKISGISSDDESSFETITTRDVVADIVIGGVLPGSGNVISNNRENGINWQIGGAGLKIQGNIIGLDAGGTVKMGNGEDGIRLITNRIPDDFLLIGGLEPGAGNVIAGNSGSGVSIVQGAAKICGNRIGLNAAGTQGRGNGADGIVVAGHTPTIVGGKRQSLLLCAPNVIADNGAHGIRVVPGDFLEEDFFDPEDFETQLGPFIQGNLIGVAADGRTSLQNTENGIDVQLTPKLSISGNTVRGHQSASADSTSDVGIRIRKSQSIFMTGNLITQNSFGIVIQDTQPVNILGNTLTQNETCALVNTAKGIGVGPGFIITGNVLKDCSRSSTGLHLTDVENARITGNQFVNNAGAG